MAHVSRTDLENYLDRVRARTKDTKDGIFGPDSLMWKIGREAIGGVGGGRALLLQTAHPFVAHAVQQHSKVKTDTHGRGVRTFKNVLAMTFGDLDAAFRAARRVHTVHEKIHGFINERNGRFDNGAPYDANDDEALLWVHATLWESSMLMYERVFGPQPLELKNKYYEETKFFAYLFGIPDRILPPNWSEFLEYNWKMWESDTLAVGEAGADIAKFVLTAPKENMQPVMDWFKIMTAGLLPKRIRHQYQFKYGAAEKAIFEASMQAIKYAYPLVHPRLRFSPVYFKALERTGRDREMGFVDRYLKKRMQKMLNPTGYKFVDA